MLKIIARLVAFFGVLLYLFMLSSAYSKGKLKRP
jgi:hypothetical protein